MSKAPDSQQNEKSEQTEPVATGVELGSLVMELEDLVKIALAAENNEVDVSIGSFVEVHKKLMAIYKMLEEFRTQYAKALATIGLTPEDMKLTNEQITELGPKERRLFEKLTSLQTVCEEAKERVHQSLQKSPGAVKEIKEELKGPEGKALRRKDRFKGAGGKKGWLPS